MTRQTDGTGSRGDAWRERERDSEAIEKSTGSPPRNAIIWIQTQRSWPVKVLLNVNPKPETRFNFYLLRSLSHGNQMDKKPILIILIIIMGAKILLEKMKNSSFICCIIFKSYIQERILTIEHDDGNFGFKFDWIMIHLNGASGKLKSGIFKLGSFWSFV